MNVTPDSPALKSNKLLVIGESQCGKTSLINYYCNPDKSPQKVSKTTGCDIHIKELITNTNEEPSVEYVEFWDLNADSTPTAILQTYLQPILRDIECLKGVIFFFDVFNVKSFLRLRKYLEDVIIYILEQKKMLLTRADEVASIPLFVVGNKRDLLDDESAAKKMVVVTDYLKLFFEENSNLNCIFLSLDYDYAQFEGLDNFVRHSIKGECSDLYLYRGPQISWSNEKLNTYKEKLLALGKDLTRMKDYLYLQKTNISSYVTTLVTPPKFRDVSKFIWRE